MLATRRACLMAGGVCVVASTVLKALSGHAREERSNGSFFQGKAWGRRKSRMLCVRLFHREMAGEGEIRKALRIKAGGHHPLSVTTSITPHKKSSFPLPTPTTAVEASRSVRRNSILTVLWRKSYGAGLASCYAARSGALLICPDFGMSPSAPVAAVRQLL
jgi:hypothetical protein